MWSKFKTWWGELPLSKLSSKHIALLIVTTLVIALVTFYCLYMASIHIWLAGVWDKKWNWEIIIQALIALILLLTAIIYLLTYRLNKQHYLDKLILEQSKNNFDDIYNTFINEDYKNGVSNDRCDWVYASSILLRTIKDSSLIKGETVKNIFIVERDKFCKKLTKHLSHLPTSFYTTYKDWEDGDDLDEIIKKQKDNITAYPVQFNYLTPIGNGDYLGIAPDSIYVVYSFLESFLTDLEYSNIDSKEIKAWGKEVCPGNYEGAKKYIWHYFNKRPNLT